MVVNSYALFLYFFSSGLVGIRICVFRINCLLIAYSAFKCPFQERASATLGERGQALCAMNPRREESLARAQRPVGVSQSDEVGVEAQVQVLVLVLGFLLWLARASSSRVTHSDSFGC